MEASYATRSKKIRQNLGIIRKIKRYLNTPTLLQLYHITYKIFNHELAPWKRNYSEIYPGINK